MRSQSPKTHHHRIPFALVFYELCVVVCLAHRFQILTSAHASADLDRSNVSNAYVSGMREDLHMFGTEFNVRVCSNQQQYTFSGLKKWRQKINTIFTCGYIVGMIPSKSQRYSSWGMIERLSLDNLMLQRVPPRIWFPSMQIIWGVLTFWCVLLFSRCTYQRNVLCLPLSSTAAVTKVEQVDLFHLSTFEV